MTSLQCVTIDHIINVKSSIKKDLELNESKRTLLREYYNVAEVFLKKKLDKLLSYRPRVDRDIVLKAEASPRYCPLYKLFLKELKTIK